MKVVLIDVSSLDGKLTKWTGDNIYEWSSDEDFKNFQKVKKANNLLVMGSGTFEKVKDVEKAGLKAEKNRLRVILTQHPTKYKKFAVPGQLEFSNETPQALVKRLGENGYKQLLLVSGGKVATSFFKANLVNELWLTIEPRIFGIGEPLVQSEKFDIQLELLQSKKLNKQGSLFLKYKVIQ